MCDTIDEEITPEIIASQVMFERDAHAGAIVIVEGDSDSLFFKNFIDNNQCKVVVARGKENALGAIKILNSDYINGILCIVDADFHHLDFSIISETKNIAITDYHDIEIMLFESSSFEKLISEYGHKEKVSNFTRQGVDLRSIIYNVAKIIGAFRLWSVEKEQYLTFNRMENGGYTFIELKDLSCNTQTLINSVKNVSKKYHLVEQEVEKEIATIISRNYDCKQLCCGHDVCWVISRGLRRLLGSEDDKSVSKKNIERNLRLGYEDIFFIKTDLYKSIISWQSEQHDFIVLRASS